MSTMNIIKSMQAETDRLQDEIDRLREQLNKEMDRNHELKALLAESGYRRRHQIEDDGGDAEEDAVHVQNGDLALTVFVESKQAAGLEVSVHAHDYARMTSAIGTASVLREAAKRADAIISHENGLLRRELNRSAIVGILEDQLRWAHESLRPHPAKPGKKQGWGMTR